MRLTKSKYCKGIDCPKALYLGVHHKELATPFSPSTELRFSEGHEVGKFAQTFYPDGVLIDEDYRQLDLAASKTKKLVEEATVSAIFEATFSYENVLCRVDILRNNQDGTWDILEVKSTKQVKEEHHDDVAVQLWVLQSCGLKIKSVYLKHINPDFVSPDWKNFFTDSDLTDIARSKALTEVPLRVKDQFKMLSVKEPPHVLLGSHCEGCEFQAHCWKDIPKGSTLELYRSKKRFDIFYNQFEMIEDIKIEEVKLTEFQVRQWKASQTDEPIANESVIFKELKALKFPLYFFDFETIAPAMPILEGMASYQKIPVQWSCHIIRSPKSAIEHHEYLYDPLSKQDHRLACIESMQKLFQEFTGTIVAYHASFEKGVIQGLAEQFTAHRSFLLNLCDQFWDLEEIFQKHYYHKEMEGSCSIKSVLPHFAPELDYGDLQVQDGGDAEALLLELCKQRIPAEDIPKSREALLKYCERDSLAMLVIYSKLLELVGEPAPALPSKKKLKK